MTENEFANVMQDISNAYRGKFAIKPDDSDEVKDEVLTTWYKFFKDYRAEAFEEVSRGWIEKEDKAPLIKDLKAKTEFIDERIKKAEKRNEPEEVRIPTEWDFRQSSDSKIMTYAEWVYKYFGVRIEDEVHTI